MSSTILSVVSAVKATVAGAERGVAIMRNLEAALLAQPSQLAVVTRRVVTILEARRDEEESAMQALVLSATPFLAVDWDAIERDPFLVNDAMLEPGANGDNLHTLAEVPQLPYTEPVTEPVCPDVCPLATAREATEAPAEPVKRSRARKTAS